MTESAFLTACVDLGERPVGPGLSLLVARCQAQVESYVTAGRRNGRPMKLEIGFVDDPTFNGWATTVGDIDVIGLNVGVPVVLHGILRALLSHPYLFPDVGDVSRCTPRRLESQIRGVPDDARSWPNEPLGCSDRDRLARDLAEGALVHTLVHEFAHIWFGHTDLLRLNFQRSRHRINDPAVSDLTSQTLEWDADAFATQYVLERALRPNIEIVDAHARWRLVGADPWGGEERATQAALLVASVFDCLTSDLNDLVLPDCLQSSHPPAMFRALSHHSLLTTVLWFRAKLPQEHTAPACNDVLNRMFSAIKGVVPGSPLEGVWPEQRDLLVERCLALRSIYSEAWADLCPKLDPLKRGGVLAAPGDPTAPL